MSNIKDALKMRPHKFMCASVGLELELRRPSMVDYALAMEEAKRDEAGFAYWLVLNHLTENGNPVFKSRKEVEECEVKLILEIASEIDKLYGEGRD